MSSSLVENETVPVNSDYNQITTNVVITYEKVKVQDWSQHSTPQPIEFKNDTNNHQRLSSTLNQQALTTSGSGQ